MKRYTRGRSLLPYRLRYNHTQKNARRKTTNQSSGYDCNVFGKKKESSGQKKFVIIYFVHEFPRIDHE
ncbi:MAG: hypothetical protein LBK06_02260 [Planctomycetaceae bacterium]|nr:hypothetical protein [Planctomycetaceae bacterium]